MDIVKELGPVNTRNWENGVSLMGLSFEAASSSLQSIGTSIFCCRLSALLSSAYLRLLEADT